MNGLTWINHCLVDGWASRQHMGAWVDAIGRVAHLLAQLSLHGWLIILVLLIPVVTIVPHGCFRGSVLDTGSAYLESRVQSQSSIVCSAESQQALNMTSCRRLGIPGIFVQRLIE